MRSGRPDDVPGPLMELLTGAEARLTNPGGTRAVVCVNGGTGKEVPGTWAATLELLVTRLAPQLPELTFAEVRYRIKSWKRLTWCIDDCRAAITLAAGEGAEEIALLGFSMGGAVAVAAADHPLVTELVLLAPWIPDRIDVHALSGRRVTILHGALDRWLPGIPGVHPNGSLRGYERMKDAGVDVTHTVIPGALHGTAVRSRRTGRLVPLPRARRWTELVGEELGRFAHPPKEET